MEISSENFWESLAVVIEAIATATYVSFDLEMTGIYTKTSMAFAKLAINMVYEKAKEAAERFQIVQFGLTCISYDKKAGEYHSKTFNFLLTPFFMGYRPVDKRLAKCLDRYVGFSQSSVMFLRDHDFHMDRAFRDGVSYLSQTEITKLTSKFLHPFDKSDPADRLDLTDYDQEAIDFHNYAMNIINDWYTREPRERTYCNITNPHGGRLNALQVRIVSELVQDHYSDCRALPRDNRAFMQVTIRNAAAEEQLAVKMLAERQDAVNRQKGFLFVMEALMGIDFLETLPVEYLIPSAAPDRPGAVSQMIERLRRLQDKLTNEQPLLIGHNSLNDLCFIYHSFCGPLPSTIEKFGAEIRFLFPKMVDTKYIARREGNHSMLADDSLAELFRSAMKLPLPQIRQDPDMPEVDRAGHGAAIAAHQAGYDSWMTAVVFLKYAWGLVKKAAAYKSPTESEKDRTKTAEEQSAAVTQQLSEAIKNTDLTSGSEAWAKHHKFEQERRAAQQASGSDPELSPLLPHFPAPRAPSYGTMHPDTSWLFDEPPPPPSKLGPATAAAAAADDDNTCPLDSADAGKPGWWEPLVPSGTALLLPSSPVRGPAVCLNSQPPLRVGGLTTTDCGSAAGEEEEEDGVLPGWESAFWRAYGNKVRVGTAGVLDLDLCEGGGDGR